MPIDFPIEEETPVTMVASILAIIERKGKSVPAAFVVVNQYLDGETPIVVKRYAASFQLAPQKPSVWEYIPAAAKVGNCR